MDKQSRVILSTDTVPGQIVLYTFKRLLLKHNIICCKQHEGRKPHIGCFCNNSKHLPRLARLDITEQKTNAMLKVDRPKKNSFRPNFYSKDEVQQLLEVSQDDPLHLCILITAYYGLRRSEVLGLKWSSIDFERKSITINHKVTEQLVNGKYVPVVSDVMKNKTSCRTLPLIPAVEEELLKQKEKQQLYRKLFKKSYSTEYLDFVCTDQEGKLIRPNFVTEHFDWLLTKYGLKHIRFHDLRHSCASLMVMNGVSMKQVQEWLGHSTFSTTADIYAHLDYKSKQGSAGVIANLLGESKLPK